MKKNKLPIYFIVIVVIVLSFILYRNSILRIEYENDIVLPNSTEVISIKSLWFIPRNSKLDRSIRSEIILKKDDFQKFIDSLKNCQKCDNIKFEEGEKFCLYPTKYADVTWIYIEKKLEDERLLICIETQYT